MEYIYADKPDVPNWIKETHLSSEYLKQLDPILEFLKERDLRRKQKGSISDISINSLKPIERGYVDFFRYKGYERIVTEKNKGAIEELDKICDGLISQINKKIGQIRNIENSKLMKIKEEELKNLTERVIELVLGK
jgi:hypothetical protein